MRLSEILENSNKLAKKLKKQVYTLFFAYKDARTPWYAKLFTACVVAYAFSPIDLIPDIIPILGYLDDLILVPLGVAIALKIIPKPVLADSALKADDLMIHGKPKNWVVGVFIIVIWLLLAVWVTLMALRMV
jgi:uncharacterized membrane protein YkvA (DUF1232 family)